MDCIFCKIVDREIPAEILYEDEDLMAILDISQATKGHALVIPKKHVRTVLELDEAMLGKMGVVIKVLATALKKAYACDGFNILSNCEEAAGQVVFHAHTHLIPRYSLDSVSIHLPNQMGTYDLKALKEEIVTQMQ